VGLLLGFGRGRVTGQRSGMVVVRAKECTGVQV
jgi:hypothetical protein